MARSKKSASPSPTLNIKITDEQVKTAKRSNSGGCLIADAIKAQYPQFSRVDVDMATVRVSDPKRGERYVYLTPPAAQHLLLAFDQGWPLPTDTVQIRRAVQILPMIRAKTGSTSIPAVRERRQERIAQLELKQESDEELTTGEKIALTTMKKNEAADPPPDRPTSTGPAEVVEAGSTQSRERPTIRGGKPRIKPPVNANLLAGRNRHFGARIADPGLAFTEAVNQAVADHLASLDDSPEVDV